MAIAIVLNWQGPFRCVEANKTGLPKNEPGVYLWTVLVGEKYLVNYVGESATVVSRWSSQVRDVLGGRSRVFNPDKLQTGELDELYRDNGGSHNLAALSPSVVQAAFDNIRVSSLFFAPLGDEKTVRLSVESGIISEIRKSESARGILTNGGALIEEAARKVDVTSKWPENICVDGIPDSFSFGERE